MKVIEMGDGRKGWSKEYRCTGAGNDIDGGCGALLLVEEGDLYYTWAFEREGYGEKFTTFRCPECNNQTDIKGVPSNVNIRSEETPKYNNSERPKMKDITKNMDFELLSELSELDKDVKLYAKIMKLQEAGEVSQEFLKYEGHKNVFSIK